MIRYQFLTAVLVLLAAACGGDGDGSSETPGPEDGGTSTVQVTEAADEAASPSPDGGGTPSPLTTEDTPQSPTPTATPAGTPAAAATPLPVEGVTKLVECDFDVDASVADCPGQGTYAIDPPLSPVYEDCDLLLLRDRPVMLVCNGGETAPTVYYVIPE